jgi:subtilisin-like proprotein convertase family protein
MNDSDPDSQMLFVAALGTPANGSAAIVGSQVVYTPSADYNGSDGFTYVASDGTLTDTAFVTVTITPVNDAPQFTKGADQTVAEDSGPRTVPGWASGVRPGPLTAADEVGQALTFALTNDNNALFSIQPAVNAAGTLAFTPAANAYGSATVTVTLSDDGGTANGGVDTSAPQVFAITVTPVNDPPLASDVLTTTLEDTPLSITIIPGYASDPVEGDPVSLFAVGAPGNGLASVSTPQSLVYTPTLNFNGLDTFTYTVRDSGGAGATARITVTVAAVNDPPTLGPLSDLTIDEDAPTQTVVLSGISSGAANEAQTLVVTAVSTNTALIPHPAVTYASPNPTGSLRFAPLADKFGMAGMVVTVTDGLSTTVRSFRVTVRPTGFFIYVADGAGGVQVLDVANPRAPRLISAYSPAWVAYGVSVAGSRAYVATGFSGLRVIDVADPTSLRELGDFGWNDGDAQGVAISGTLAYVADGNRNRMRVLNVADPASIVQVGLYTATAPIYDVAVVGNTAYVAASYGGLQLVNVSNPASPQLLGQASALDARGVAISGTLAYVADGSAGLRVVNVSNPSSPYLVRTFDTPGYAMDTVTARGLVYVADYNKGLRVINPNGISPQVQACDTAGNCTTSMFSTQVLASAAQATAQDAITLSVALNVPPVLESADPISVTGAAETSVSSLRALTITADGGVIHTDAWAAGAITQTAWAANWAPGGEGPHVLQALVTAWDGNTANDTLTTTVDVQPPEVIIAPTLFTSTNYYEPHTLDLTGLVTDTGGVAGVRVYVGQNAATSYDATIEGGGATAPVTATWRAAWPLDSGALPDGTTFTVTAEARDIVGRATLVTQTVLVDVSPPAPVVLALTSGATSLAPGDTLRELSPTLTLTWTAASDGSGLAGYVVEWLVTDGISRTSEVSQTSEVSSAYVAGDGQKVTVQVAGEDVYGQRSWQGTGPVYVDSPDTPDYVALDDSDGVYYGWMASGCTLVGVDRRVAQSAPAGAALDAVQRFYVTWNAQALRLAWTGANWNTDGDLFIYLDTQPGGATTTLTPSLTAGTLISLPEGLAADFLVWVRDSQTALLLNWNGSVWDFQAALSTEQHRFDAALNGGQTDLYLPFDQIGLAGGGGLDLVAFASDDDTLSLWATMPPANPVNSARVIAAGAPADAVTVFALTQAYHWDNLGGGICPNGSTGGAAPPFVDADVQVSISSDPQGAAYSLLGDHLFWLQDLLLGSPPADVTSYLDFMDTTYPSLGNGQAIIYTLHYHNRGTYTATNVYADVSALYTLRLVPGDSHQVVNLGDVGPGEEGTVTFSGMVDTSRSSEPWAAVAVEIYDDGHGPAGQPLEWLWVHHRVDRSGPQFFGIQRPGYVVGTGGVDMGGYAYDEAGVPGIALEVESPVTGTLTIPCTDNRPDDGQWACAWNVTAFNGGTPPADGTLLNVRLHATDGLGQESAWADPLPFTVDARPPTVTLSVTATQVFSGSLVRDSVFTLGGEAFDDGGVAGVDVCVDGDCGAANLQLMAGATAVSSEDVPQNPVAIGSGTGCVTRFFTVTESLAVAQASLGFVANHPRRDDLRVELTSPAGTTVRVLDDDGISGTQFRNYDVLLDDTAPTGLAEAWGNDDSSADLYERFTRPYQPLRAFQGEDAQGVWILRICDMNSLANDGGYIAGRLALTPRDTAVKSGRWLHQTPDQGALDYISRTIAIYGQDAVGNRTTDPLSLLVWVDNVAPVVTVTMAVPEFYLDEGSTTVLSGTVTDGGPTSDVSLLVQTPDGEFQRTGAARDGAQWWFDLQPWNPGRYVLWVSASDLAGNVTTAGPFAVQVKLRQVFLPLVARNYVVAPDLVVERIVAGTNSIAVVIHNQGNAPSVDDFWVDVYVNPYTPPTHVNQIWSDVAGQGLVWGVTADLQPGETLTLTVGGAYYVAEYSHVAWPLAAGTPVYAQVDSANADTTYGGVLEDHEITGGAYNNIAGPISVTAATGGAAAATGRSPTLPGALPRRP